MKHLLAIVALATVAYNGMAQQNVTTAFAKPSEMSRIIHSLPEANAIGHESEQGRDRLDSTYYMRAKGYEFEYEGTKDKQYVDNLIASIVKAYDADLPNHTGGFCSSYKLTLDNSQESRRLQMYYSADNEPLTIGGPGQNYALLRTNSPQNPNYRHVEGLSWMLVTNGQSKHVVRFMTFSVFGPMTKSHYQTALRQARRSRNDAEDNASVNSPKVEADGTLTLTENFDLKSEVFQVLMNGSATSGLLGEIAVLKKLVKADSDDIFSNGAIQSINERIKVYMDRATTGEEKLQLFHVLDSIPGYYAQIVFGDGKRLSGSFSWLEKQLPKLDVVDHRYTHRDNPDCFVVQDKDNNSQVISAANFIYAVVVSNTNIEDFK
ncbi:MAG: hypothetical protein HUK01_02225 [Bacteroidaceae bacterium]|nr:hypothetical protein [Bacteroidaceae bacterium]